MAANQPRLAASRWRIHMLLCGSPGSFDNKHHSCGIWKPTDDMATSIGWVLYPSRPFLVHPNLIRPVGVTMVSLMLTLEIVVLVS